MSIAEYEYRIEECDVPHVRRAVLKEYRTFRRKCLECLHGAADTSVTNQISDLAWHTAVFRTLNEARRIEPDHSVNGALWELTTAGYASLMTLGIRKLVDKNPKTDSVWNLISTIERRPELLTREMFVCYDGLPYDYEAVKNADYASLDLRGGGLARRYPTRGPKAWGTSEMMHSAFDKLSDNTTKRKRSDKIQPSILAVAKKHLSHPAIEKVRTFANGRVAHAQRISETSRPVPIATYNEIDNALQQIVRVVSVVSSTIFYNEAIGSVVPIPQFDVLESLDQAWVTAENISKLHKYWDELSETMNSWTEYGDDDFLGCRAIG